MVVYIEYAFLENFFFDGALLTLALVAARQRPKWWKIALSALFGGIFALIFPVLTLPFAVGILLKISIAFLLCLLPFSRLKTKKEWGRYALTVTFFFVFTFAFGGALTGAYTAFSLSKLPNFAVIIGFCLLCLFSCLFIVKMREKRRFYAYLYPCTVFINGKNAPAYGYFDSGNLAMQKGVPVCFLSADLFYEIYGEKWLFDEEEWGQVRDEMQITTMTGVKKVPLYLGEIEVKTDKKERIKRVVYFAPSTNMIQREYKILLNGRIFEQITEKGE